MKKALTLLVLALSLSACANNPIDTLDSKIKAGKVGEVPPVDAGQIIPEEPASTPQMDVSGHNLEPTYDVDLNSPEFTPTPTPAMTTNNNQPQTMSQPPAKQPTMATIQTSKGNITFKFFGDIAPGTVNNFIQKSASGFYNGLTFHRVEDWVVQGGDPLGNGTGGGNMPTELSQQPFTTGSVGIARGGDIKVSNDSQFFICKTDCSFLTGQYTIFGQVESGMEVVNQIAIGDKITSIALQ